MAKTKTPPGPPPPSEQELERRHARAIFRMTLIGRVSVTAVIAAGVVGFAYVTFYLPVAVSHGETTTISVMQTWAANVNASVWVSWVATEAASVAAYKMRRQWVKERTERDARIKELELQLDPKRTSSQVDQAGDPQQGPQP